jgi:hypothetical protein
MLALPCPVQQGVELGAQGLAHRGRDRHQFLRELEERVAQASPHAYAREQRPQTLLNSAKGSPLLTGLQNRACQFPGTRLLSDTLLS